ncbi:MAG TPA: hypothetical protein VJB63_04060 [Patescibacteria group bacterium]|nr:hypothetical protein [Patescibacteria group bacterium]
MHKERQIFNLTPSDEERYTKYPMVERLCALFPREQGLITSGHFFTHIVFDGHGIFLSPLAFYIAGDHNLLGKCVARSIKDDKVFMDALFFSHNIRSKIGIISEPELRTGEETLFHFQHDPGAHFSVRVDALFIYPTAVINQAPMKANTHFL